MAYTAKHDVEHDQVRYAPGDPVRFSADDLADYQDAGIGPIAELLACGAIEGEKPVAGAALADQSVEQLVAVATLLGLTMPVPLERDTLLAAIAEAKARLAAPPAPPSNTPPLPPVGGAVPTAEGTKLTPSEPLELPTLSLDLGVPRLSEIATAEGLSYATDADAAALISLIEAARVGRVERGDLPALRANLSLGRLTEIANAEQVEFAPNASRAEPIAAIEAKRAAPPVPPAA